MKIYTSYFGRLNKLERAGIEPVAICRGKPKWFKGRCVDKLAPTWPMMQMQLPKFWESYAKMLEPMDARELADAIWRGRKRGCEAVALLCYEKDAAECHRHVVADWMTKAGIEVVEWEPSEKPVPQVDFDWKTVQLTFLDHQVCDLNRLCEKAAKADVELAVPMELFEPFVEALQATKKYGDVKNAGAAVWLMTRAALRQFGEDDGRAYTPIMKLFGRAAIPTTTYEGVKSIIERKMKAGEISQPWEIFENMLGETYGARGRKAD